MPLSNLLTTWKKQFSPLQFADPEAMTHYSSWIENRTVIKRINPVSRRIKECLILEVEGIGLTSAEQQYGDSFSRH